MAEVLAGCLPLLAILALLLGLSAFFSASETAVFNLGPADVRDLAAARPARARLVKRLLDRRGALLVTVLLGNLVVNISWFNLGTLLAIRFDQAALPGAAAATPVVVVLLLILGGEVIPKIIAVHGPLRIATLVAAPLLLIERLLFGPRVVLAGITDLLTRLLVGQRKAEGDLLPEELQHLLEVAAREGHIAPDESERLQGVLVLSRMAVRDIMVPRMGIVAFPLGESRERLLDLVATHRRNKIPVYRESLDHVEGFLDIKEVLALPGASLESLVKPVVYVPETALVAQVLERFLGQKVRLMIVVDEYGGTDGLLTHEDLVEAIVGDLSDESDLAVPEVIHLGPGHLSVDAGLSISTWGRLVRRDVADLGATTVGGLVTALLGRLPRLGDRAVLGRVSLEVVAMKGRRPDRVVVRLRPPREGER